MEAMRGNVSEPGKVVVVGSINQDLTTYAPSLPAPGQTILGSDFITTPGGKGANQAVAASIIGAVPDTGLCGVHMIGRVGDDVMGGALITGLRAKGVRIDEGEASVAGAHTGVASIVVDSTSGQNTIVVAPGANLALAEKDVESALGSLLESNSQRNVVLVQLEITPESALKSLATASMLGALTILNPAPAPKGWALTDEWFGTIDILVPNETELASLCGVSDSEVVTGEGEDAMARSLLERGVRQAVIVTLGARGAMIVRRNEEGDTQASAALDSSDDNLQTIMISEPADLPCKSETVVDAVGAGDAFCGALAAYLSRGVELEQAASMACGVASMSVRKRGAQESYPSAEDLPDCLRLDEDASTIDYTEESVAQRRKTVTFVTGNKNKLSEVQRLLSTSSDGAQQFPFDIDNRKLDLPELQGSPHEIALEKCKAASEQLQTAVITEDTCLCFRALKDLPGPYIKWFLDDLGHDGLNKLLHGFDDTRAYAMTIIGFCAGPGQEVKLFEGRTEGNIVPARGSLDFGWDPIFKPTKEEQGEGKQKTYAEMTKDEKNAISHRGGHFRSTGLLFLGHSPSDGGPDCKRRSGRDLRSPGKGVTTVWTEKELVDKGTRRLVVIQEGGDMFSSNFTFVEYAGVRKAKFVSKDAERFEAMIEGALEKLGESFDGINATKVVLLKENGTICRRNTLTRLHRNNIVVMRCTNDADEEDSDSE